MAAAVMRICKLGRVCQGVFPFKPRAFSNVFSWYDNINKKTCVLQCFLENAPQINRNGVHAPRSLKKPGPAAGNSLHGAPGADVGTDPAVCPSVASRGLARVVLLASCVSVRL